jgi:hypothetical protein
MVEGATPWKLETFTAVNGYKIDKVETGLLIKVDCNFPCLTCDETNKSNCNSCIMETKFDKL